MWSIGIYTGPTPFKLSATTTNPVLTKESVTDVRSSFVADPFMVHHDDIWYMFFEVMNEASAKGDIGLATSDNGIDFDYQQIVLSESFHLSYPGVFQWRDEFYMVPETLGAGAVCLYRADPFPHGWTMQAKILNGSYADPSLFRFGDKWWMFVCSTPYQHDELRLYFASELLGEWREHPASPIVTANKRDARPAGRVITYNNNLVRFAQDCTQRYGAAVSAFEIVELTSHRYREQPCRLNPILCGSGGGWNGLGMHHVDAHFENGRWIACVDGYASNS